MSKKRKELSKTKIRDFLPTSKERDDALEESGFLGDPDDFFDDDEDED